MLYKLAEQIKNNLCHKIMLAANLKGLSPVTNHSSNYCSNPDGCAFAQII